MLCRLSQQLAALTEDAERIPANQQGAGEDMSGLVDGIMHQLLAKDVLYQPIQEIGSRYPQWLQDHRCSTAALPPTMFQATSIVAQQRKLKRKGWGCHLVCMRTRFDVHRHCMGVHNCKVSLRGSFAELDRTPYNVQSRKEI